jgi:hypothetical protein
MHIKQYLVIAITPLVFSCASGADSLFFEGRAITEGDYRGIQIGMSKQQVIPALGRLGVMWAKVIPRVKFQITAANTDQLRLIENAEGVRVMNYRGFSIDITFANGVVSAIVRSVPAQGTSLFREGETASDVASTLRQLLIDDPGLIVIPIIRAAHLNGGAAELSSARDVAELIQYDKWDVELGDEKPRGAGLELVFKNNRLDRIQYRRSRIPLE